MAGSVQVRVVAGKKDELVLGPADAEVVVSIGKADADAGLDPTVAYMQGKLKATGHTGELLDALRSGEIARLIAASRT
jgi:hypothetical protein